MKINNAGAGAFDDTAQLAGFIDSLIQDNDFAEAEKYGLREVNTTLMSLHKAVKRQAKEIEAIKAKDQAPERDRMVRIDEVLPRVGVKKTTLYGWIKAGTFPEPFRLGARCVAWRMSDVEGWFAGLEAKRGELQ